MVKLQSTQRCHAGKEWWKFLCSNALSPRMYVGQTAGICLNNVQANEEDKSKLLFGESIDRDNVKLSRLLQGVRAGFLGKMPGGLGRSKCGLGESLTMLQASSFNLENLCNNSQCSV